MARDRFEDTGSSASHTGPVSSFFLQVAQGALDQGQVLRTVLIWVLFGGGLELLGRILRVLNLITSPVRDLFSLGAVLILAVMALYVLAQLRHVRRVRRMLVAGIGLILLSLGFGLIDDASATQRLFAADQYALLYVCLGHTASVAGFVLLVAGFLSGLVEGERAQRRLREERRTLRRHIQRRKAAEAELKTVRAELEDTVAERTAELAQSNEQLRKELNDRLKVENMLGMRLRYEEGLAACSQALLTDTEPEEGLDKAMRHLLAATGASRVFLFENVHDHEKGFSMELKHHVVSDEAHNEVLAQQAEGLRISYSDGLRRWQSDLSQGTPVTGTRPSFPPSEQRHMADFNSQSILLLPIGWEGRWRGFLGFDEVARAREWSPEEVRLLRTAAEMMGACRERARAETILRSAYSDLEARVSERTAELLETNRQLQREIADRRRAEEATQELETQLGQAQKMQAIGTLAGGIAHDFNNILSSILGYAELGMNKTSDDAPQLRYFREVVRAGNRAKELVRQILLFSRQGDQEEAPVHLHLIAKEVVSALRAQCPQNIEIRAFIDQEAGAVIGDPVQMHQVLLNLCTNAQHAMGDDGGLLEVRVEPLHIESHYPAQHGALSEGEYVRVRVTDTGHGMDPQTEQRIFEPFFTTKNVGEGTGMGLAIVHGIVLDHGGALNVKTQPGAGTTFEIFLPRHPAPAERAAAGAPRALHGVERIMVVDDEPQLVALWTEMLQQFGYQVQAYYDGAEALQAFKQDPAACALALIDQMMPGMTGAELARKMLEIRPGVPIIMATGFSESITPEDALAMGIAEFVYKPILGEDLGAAIRRTLERQAADTPSATEA